MNDFEHWLTLALGQDLNVTLKETPAEAKLRAAEDAFLADLRAARIRVAADGLQALLEAHECTIGDDPQFGLPRQTRVA